MAVPVIFTNAFKAVRRAWPNTGLCAEFGIGQGTTYIYQVDEILNKSLNYKLIGFDSFQGLPDETPGVWCPEPHKKGKLRYPGSYVLDSLSKRDIVPGNPQFEIVIGFFDRTLSVQRQRILDKIIFVNIDCDLHSSALEALNFVTPLLQVGTILYFDDWKDPNHKCDEEWGEHLAYRQWIDKNPTIKTEVLEVNKYNQRYMEVVAL